MSFADALGEAGAKPAGKRPWFMARDAERVLAITMAVAQELAIARQRIDTLERLLATHGVLRSDEVETYVPDTRAATERAMWNQEYIARILRIIQQENEAASTPDDVASEEVGNELAGGA